MKNIFKKIYSVVVLSYFLCIGTYANTIDSNELVVIKNNPENNIQEKREIKQLKREIKQLKRRDEKAKIFIAVIQSEKEDIENKNKRMELLMKRNSITLGKNKKGTKKLHNIINKHNLEREKLLKTLNEKEQYFKKPQKFLEDVINGGGYVAIFFIYGFSVIVFYIIFWIYTSPLRFIRWLYRIVSGTQEDETSEDKYKKLEYKIKKLTNDNTNLKYDKVLLRTKIKNLKSSKTILQKKEFNKKNNYSVGRSGNTKKYQFVSEKDEIYIPQKMDILHDDIGDKKTSSSNNFNIPLKSTDKKSEDILIPKEIKIKTDTLKKKILKKSFNIYDKSTNKKSIFD